ncbi:MAG: TolC family protein [Deltaproteobacteria bacterium]|nr:TolC family protein [Deltaproteobacteria bacterium]
MRGINQLLSRRLRRAQKFDLKVAEYKFIPKVMLDSTAQRNSSSVTGDDPRLTTGSFVSDNATFSATVTQQLPTGGRLDLTAAHYLDSAHTTGLQRADSYGLFLTQPLLKGGGMEVGTASIKNARFTDSVNQLYLKTTLMDTVSSVIYAYWYFLQTVKQIEISRQSLERAKESMAVTRELITAGRMSEMEIVQNEADIANREISLLSSENNADAARIALLKLFDLGRNTPLVPTEPLTVESALPTYEECRQQAFVNRTDYLIAALNVDIAKTNVTVAQNNRLWDLSLIGGVEKSPVTAWEQPRFEGTTDNWNTGIRLSIPLGDLTPQQGYVAAKVGLDKAEVAFAKVKDTVELELRDTLREAEMKLRQVKLAQESRKLYERKLDVEKEKLRAGRSTNFQVVSSQNDLFFARNYELTSIISYVTARTALDRVLGVTLEKWGIKVADRSGDEKYYK